MVVEAEFKKYTEQNHELAESRNRCLRERERISELLFAGSRNKERHAYWQAYQCCT